MDTQIHFGMRFVGAEEVSFGSLISMKISIRFRFSTKKTLISNSFFFFQPNILESIKCLIKASHAKIQISNNNIFAVDCLCYDVKTITRLAFVE